MLLILVSGLPRAGKTTLADALASEGYTHVPLDRYFAPSPASTSFLEWVSTPKCIDWPLVNEHLDTLEAGQWLDAPDDRGGLSWGVGGLQVMPPGSGPRRRMRPSGLGYVVPGCYAFSLSRVRARQVRVFVEVPRAVIAERALSGPVASADVEATLDRHLSANWREIEGFARHADVVVSGVASREEQVALVRSALEAACSREIG